MWLPSSSRSMKAAIVRSLLMFELSAAKYSASICQLLKCSLLMFDLVTACVSVHCLRFCSLPCFMMSDPFVASCCYGGWIFINITKKLCFSNSGRPQIYQLDFSEHYCMREEKNIFDVFAAYKITTSSGFTIYKR